ncbi:MAG TPA: cytochrome c biogenesis protein CcsA [Solimonas sp.]|nr:cytochrome c biogenesis protein CcsA [Solimonas sp.]
MILTFLATLLYLATALGIWRQWSAVWPERLLPPVALLLHGIALGGHVFHHGAVTLGIAEAVSLFAWQSAFLLWVLCWREPLRVLGLAVYPLAATAALCALAWPSPLSETAATGWKTRSHIVLSLFSAGLLTLAAIQAGLLAIQERLLHRHRLTATGRSLPPLQTMERLLFQLIAIGFFLLSATLLSGLWFIRDWMAQHLAHKTVLSISAWFIFGVLLWGRFRYGWRGRTATRWTLAGYAMLILAYFGSKIILEQFLGRHWT